MCIKVPYQSSKTLKHISNFKPVCSPVGHNGVHVCLNGGSGPNILCDTQTNKKPNKHDCLDTTPCFQGWTGRYKHPKYSSHTAHSIYHIKHTHTYIHIHTHTHTHTTLSGSILLFQWQLLVMYIGNCRRLILNFRKDIRGSILGFVYTRKGLPV